MVDGVSTHYDRRALFPLDGLVVDRLCLPVEAGVPVLIRKRASTILPLKLL